MNLISKIIFILSFLVLIPYLIGFPGGGGSSQMESSGNEYSTLITNHESGNKVSLGNEIDNSKMRAFEASVTSSQNLETILLVIPLKL